MTSEAKGGSATGAGSESPWSRYPGFWPPPPMPPWMAALGEAWARIMGVQTNAAPGTPMAPAPIMIEAMRQWIIARADFWTRTMEAVANIASQAATMATEARKVADQMGAGCVDLWSPGAPWVPPTAPAVDIDKLRESLKGMDDAEAAKIIHAVQFIQYLDAVRNSASGGTSDRRTDDWWA